MKTAGFACLLLCTSGCRDLDFATACSENVAKCDDYDGGADTIVSDTPFDAESPADGRLDDAGGGEADATETLDGNSDVTDATLADSSDSTVFDSARADSSDVDSTMVDSYVPPDALVDSSPLDSYDSSAAADSKDSGLDAGPPADTFDAGADTRDTGCTGECSAGTVESSPTGCTGVQVRSRTCSSSCTWGAFGSCDFPTGWTEIASSVTVGFTARSQAGAVWSGTEMIVIGGNDASGAVTDGAAYNPMTNSWRKLAPSPFTSLGDNVTVWAGDRVFIWGGSAVPAATYAPGADSWNTALATSPLSGRRSPTAVWAPNTGEVIVWGGYFYPTMLADGAAYKPSTNTWRMLAPGPLAGRSETSMVYSAGRVVIFGGVCNVVTPTGCSDGAIYDPVADAWSSLAIPADVTGKRAMGASAALTWPGDRAALWGGAYGAGAWLDGFITDPEPGGVSAAIPVPPDPLGSALPSSPVGWGDGGYFCVWSPHRVLGGCYYTGTGLWSMVASGGPTARLAPATAWTGSVFIVSGGSSITGTSEYADGKLYKR